MANEPTNSEVVAGDTNVTHSDWEKQLVDWINTQHGTAGWQYKLENFIRQTHLDLLGEVEKWMCIENSISIVHQEEWEAFMKELKGRYGT